MTGIFFETFCFTGYLSGWMVPGFDRKKQLKTKQKWCHVQNMFKTVLDWVTGI